MAFLYNIIIVPIEMIIEVLFTFFFKAFGNLGLAIGGISLLVGLLSLPLYHRSDAIQRKEREQRLSMQDGIGRIKATFSGDEQYMMLSTFYRQHNYHPLYVLRSSISLLIQVPFFIAAYHFLSHLPQLQGESFLFIKDLGLPDGLINVGSIQINALPILMTIINIVTGAIYTRGFPIRDKVQLYGVAGVFLVFLYASPAGLVLYWTLNNIFSLAKNLLYLCKKPSRILYVLALIATYSLGITLLVIEPRLPMTYKAALYAMFILVPIFPLCLKGGSAVSKRFLTGVPIEAKQVNMIFVLSMLVLSVVGGIFIPARIIKSSPIEFSNLGELVSPFSFITNTASIMFGLMVLWPSVFFLLAQKPGKTVFAYVAFVLATTGLMNVFFFDGNYGTISRQFIFDNPQAVIPSLPLTIIPIASALVVAIGSLLLLSKRKERWLTGLLGILIATLSVFSISALYSINVETTSYRKNLQKDGSPNSAASALEPEFSLSATHKNVVVLFLDRAINSFLPVIVEQFPDLAHQYAGFVYYPNTVSYGAYTLLGAPPMMGGYEYTPDRINERSQEKLVDKYNESSLVLPRIFADAGYSVSVFDPPYSNFQWSKDFTAFEPYDDIKVKSLTGRYTARYKTDHQDEEFWGSGYETQLIKRRFPMFSIFKLAFPVLREIIYLNGSYFLMNETPGPVNNFLDSYSTIYYLSQLTGVDDLEGSYVFLTNDATHEPIFLQAPDYKPVGAVTDISNPLHEDSRFDEYAQIHYHANAAVMLSIGDWLDSLKERGVYDNTRIIIVADHGRDIMTPVFKDFSSDAALLGFYNPLLLVKDYDASGALMTDTQFMTNADAPLMAISNIPVSSINPFTGNDMVDEVDKSVINAYCSGSSPQSHGVNTYKFDYSRSFTVHDSIFVEDNWSRMER